MPSTNIPKYVGHQKYRCNNYFWNRRKIFQNIRKTKFCNSISHLEDNRPYALVNINGSNVNGLLDSGANISALGKNALSFIREHKLPLHPISAVVRVADGSPLGIRGFINARVRYNDRVHNMKLFIVPSLEQRLYLGCDFLQLFGMQLSFVSSLGCDPPLPTGNASPTNDNRHQLSEDQCQRLQVTIDCFPSFERSGLGRTHLVQHTIDVGDATPIKQRHYAVSPAIQQLMNNEIDRMIANDVIEESHSPWSSPMAIVKKKNGTIRLCLDARKLNGVTRKDAFPIPLIDGLLSRLDQTRFISSLDLKDAFWQIPLDPASREKTAFTIPGRPLYHFKVMPFGLCNAPQTLCRLMAQVIPHHLQEKVFVYLDDLLITTDNFDEHLSLLQVVAERLTKAGLTINVQKSKFVLNEIEYLGYVVGEGGLRPNPDKVAAISQFPAPKNVRQLRRFLGIAGWYRRFINGYSSLSSPLTSLLKKNQKFRWSEEAELAFINIKQALVSAPVLVSPNFQKRFYIQCDASSTGIGAVLFQRDEDGHDRPIAFMSKKLNPTQRNYSVTEQECLAAIEAIRKFRAYVEGLPFTVITDHASLKWLMSLKDASGRLARWSLKLQGFNFEIEYRKGSQNAVPDALSRLEMESLDIHHLPPSDSPLHVDLKSPAFQDPSYSQLAQVIQNSSKRINLVTLQNLIYLNPYPNNNLPDIPAYKLLIPESLRMVLIKAAHCPPTAAHLGIKKTTELIHRYYYWPSVIRDVVQFVNSCDECKCNKASNRISKPPLGSLPMTFRPFQRLYLDFLGPYPRTKNGKTGILIAVDHFSKFVLTKAIRQATAVEVCRFLEEDIFLMFGVPEVILTDNGKQFEALQLRKLCGKYGVRHMFTAKYSPQGNASERVNRTLLASLRAYIKHDQRVWDVNLPAITNALRNVTHSSSKYSPHFLVFGQHAILHSSVYSILRQSSPFSGNLLHSSDKPEYLHHIYGDVRRNLTKAVETSKLRYNLRVRLPKIRAGQNVYVRNFKQSSAVDKYAAKLAPKFIKGTVIKLVGNVSCEVAAEDGRSMGIYHLKDIKV